jgi:uncharacterized protein YraI
MKLTPHLLCLGVLLGFSAIAAAKPAVVLTTVNLRAAPGTTNEIVAKIPGGSLVDAASCTDGWCAVTWQEKSGFAIQTALDLSGRVPVRPAGPPRVYRTPPPGYMVDGPPVYYAPPPVYYIRPYRRYPYGRYW